MTYQYIHVFYFKLYMIYDRSCLWMKISPYFMTLGHTMKLKQILSFLRLKYFCLHQIWNGKIWTQIRLESCISWNTFEWQICHITVFITSILLTGMMLKVNRWFKVTRLWTVILQDETLFQIFTLQLMKRSNTLAYCG